MIMNLDCTVMDSSAGSQSDRSSNVSPSPPPPPPLPILNRPAMTPPISSPNHHLTRQSPLVMAASMNHQLSPPQVSTPNSIASMAHRYAGLPPPSLGLLNSLNSMVHHSPLDLMAVAHHHSQPPRSYNSPPPISSSDPTANECKLVDYRGQKVAAFMIQGDTMLCLPQAFELFLKHLVGGLHTVYTKLKRLDIVPLVCNVEQVRILRGLGAIQPGVNRCKLLSCKDFDILYRDCTTARCLMTHKTTGPDSSRPGRPPKRASVGLSLAASHLSHQLKKHRLENGGSDYGDYPNGHLQNDVPRLEKSPLLANGYHHPPTQLSQLQFLQQMNHQVQSGGTPPGVLPPHSGLSRHDAAALLKHHGSLPNIEALARSGIWENCRAAYEDIVKHLERLREERGEAERALTLDQKARDLSSHNGSSNGHSPVLNLSKGGGDHSGSEGGHTGPEDEGDDEENVTDVDEDMEEKHHPSELSDIGNDIDGSRSRKGSVSPHHALNYALGGSISPTSVLPNVDPSLSSTETLLRNIQGLLKVAADNASQQERQIKYEKAQLKMDLLREREVKDNLERQLTEERVNSQKLIKLEQKKRKRLKEKMEKLEEALKSAGAPPEALKILREELTNNNNTPAAPDHQPNSKEGSASPTPPTASPYTPPTTQSRTPTSDAPAAATGDAAKPWNYASMDLIASGTAFWQNYSESLAQELEMDRKKRQAELDRQTQTDREKERERERERDRERERERERGRETKSPPTIPEPPRPGNGYYKNSVLFSTAT